jgi:hypothetical protein
MFTPFTLIEMANIGRGALPQWILRDLGNSHPVMTRTKTSLQNHTSRTAYQRNRYVLGEQRPFWVIRDRAMNGTQQRF